MSCEKIADAVEVDTDTVREWLAEREKMLVKYRIVAQAGT